MCAWKVYGDGLCVSVRLFGLTEVSTQYVYSIFSDTNWVCSLQLPTHKRKHKHKRTLNESFTVNDKTGYYLLEPKRGYALVYPRPWVPYSTCIIIIIVTQDVYETHCYC